ncbi:hypothetical protein VC83_05295 [Pseudogymnoascus destructans]|uniref:Bicarbonate transporter-like transmembrane domain-containing protein n=2 Tax=Pseudogymnoascus destructans TaxID=655981 RepID=L8G1U2_PSED2|nr:uncharacterized protein VC83_05295 [Pseudogymnoascus destructans]ELR06648.1 hypothetical protein GMDG_00265 [Pseudogymnoascus destructans 20631-21]OAF58038.2 hypothetical protein VC83_05295 [Pseudogymnoascus destructans]
MAASPAPGREDAIMAVEQGHVARPGSQSSSSNSTDQDGSFAQSRTRTSAASGRAPAWWKVRLFRGMLKDVRRRAPFYWSDWTDAWDYRVVPATVYMYFANILPALAFSLDMFTKTDMSYGVNEVLLASVLGSIVFAVLAAQPLVIVGVTGPITVFNYTVYDIITPTGTNFFAFMCWVCLWSLVMHCALAFTNACNGLRYVTRFSCDIFGFYVAFIYIQKGIQVLTHQGYDEAFYLSIMVSLLVLGFAYGCGIVGESTMFQHYIRVFVKDYGTPLTIVFFTGFVRIGRMDGVQLQTLPTSKAFFPTADRGWLIHFWDISISDVFLAIPFAILLTILFYFDHNVSSLIAQGSEFPLRKPAGFHWDLFLLGLTTGVSGLLGIPAPNGLIPQAPFHTASLCVTKIVPASEDNDSKDHPTAVIDHVVEQRVSNLAQGLLTLGTMTGPLLIALHLIPRGVLAGLFLVMGVQALEANGITLKILFLLRDRALTLASDPLRRVSKRALYAFVSLQLLGFSATFAITQTIAAVGFPVFIFALVPLRTWAMPRWFTSEELGLMDGPTASEFTMVSVGGNFGEGDGEGDGSGVMASAENTAVSSDEELAERGQRVGAVAARDFGDRGRLGEGERVQHHGVVGEEMEMRRLSGAARRRSTASRQGAVRWT